MDDRQAQREFAKDFHRSSVYGVSAALTAMGYPAVAPEPSPNCPGTGRTWAKGPRSPICPVCLRNPHDLKVTYPGRRGGSFKGKIPAHTRIEK